MTPTSDSYVKPNFYSAFLMKIRKWYAMCNGQCETHREMERRCFSIKKRGWRNLIKCLHATKALPFSKPPSFSHRNPFQKAPFTELSALLCNTGETPPAFSNLCDIRCRMWHYSHLHVLETPSPPATLTSAKDFHPIFSWELFLIFFF